ncbi:MAG TPA: hypothetical protein VGR03_06850 [Candidatus Acidoferrum sp.]|nr:hypothetical protein [Candidatus Acidoferrum sp.]
MDELNLNAPAVDPGAGADPGVGAPAGGADPGAGAGTPGAGAPAAAAVESANAKQFREAYEALKTKYEPWEKLGAKPDEVGASHTTIQKISAEARELGEKLGFKAEQISQALKDDLAGTLIWLREETKRREDAAGGPDVREVVKRQLEEGLKPFKEQMTRQQEAEATRKSDEGNFYFNQEFKKQLEAKYPDEATRPGPLGQGKIYQMACDLMMKDKEALDGLMQGKVSSVAKYFEQANADYLALVGEHGTRENVRVQRSPGERPATPPNGKRRATLEELVEEPGHINKKYALPQR